MEDHGILNANARSNADPKALEIVWGDTETKRKTKTEKETETKVAGGRFL